jgi:hypothetical protein
VLLPIAVLLKDVAGRPPHRRPPPSQIERFLHRPLLPYVGLPIAYDEIPYIGLSKNTLPYVRLSIGHGSVGLAAAAF